MLEKMIKNRAIKKMAKIMPAYLIGSWGRSDEYTSGQVDRALKDTNCNVDYSDYAYAMFCSEEVFSEVSVANYQELSIEIGDRFFDGNNSYNFTDFSGSAFEKSFGEGYGGDSGGADGDGD